MTDSKLNSVKEKLSIAYLHAVVAKLNYALNPSSKDYDNLGIDYTIANRIIGESRSVTSESAEIKIQLKATTVSSSTMFRDLGDSIEYNLSSPIKKLFYGRFYLVVLVLPPEVTQDTWLEWSNEHMLLRRCAYFKEVKNELQGKIKIHKENCFSPTNLEKMFT